MDQHYQAQTDHDAGDSGAGERNGVPRRRPTNAQYTRSVFARPEIRALVADACQAQMNVLLEEGADDFGAQFVRHQLNEVVNELRGTA